MSDVNEKAAARDATNWAKKVSTLNVSEVPEGAVAIDVEGKRLAGPIRASGRCGRRPTRCACRRRRRRPPT